MTTKRLPSRPNLQQYRKQSKDLLKAFKVGGPDAISRIRLFHPRFKTTLSAIDAEGFRLSDAQWVIAREHGFESWPRFAAHIRRIAASETDLSAQPNLPVFSSKLNIKTDELNTCVFTRDGRRAVTGAQGNPVQVWDVETGRCVMAFDDHSAGAWAVTWSRDQRRVLFGTRDGSVKLGDVESGLCSYELTGHSDFIRCVNLSSDDGRALSASGGGLDPTIRLWDLASQRSLRIMEGHSDGIYDVAFDSAQRRALSGSRDATIRLWDLETGRCLQVFKGHTYHVHSVGWGADEQHILSCSRDIRLWDVHSGRCVRVFDQEHTETIRKLALSADRRRVLSASHDGTVRLWEIESGRCLRVFHGHPVGVINVSWSANERQAYSCDWNGGIRGWDLT